MECATESVFVGDAGIGIVLRGSSVSWPGRIDLENFQNVVDDVSEKRIAGFERNIGKNVCAASVIQGSSGSRQSSAYPSEHSSIHAVGADLGLVVVGEEFRLAAIAILGWCQTAVVGPSRAGLVLPAVIIWRMMNMRSDDRQPRPMITTRITNLVASR